MDLWVPRSLEIMCPRSHAFQAAIRPIIHGPCSLAPQRPMFPCDLVPSNQGRLVAVIRRCQFLDGTQGPWTMVSSLPGCPGFCTAFDPGYPCANISSAHSTLELLAPLGILAPPRSGNIGRWGTSNQGAPAIMPTQRPKTPWRLDRLGRIRSLGANVMVPTRDHGNHAAPRSLVPRATC
jgi:hypothetical protein